MRRVDKLKDFIGHRGLTSTASLLAVSAQRLSNWTERGVPIEHCAAIEAATQGAVRRWDLRPTDWHRIWPELVGVDGAPVIGDFSPADAGAVAERLTSATAVR